MNTKPLSFRRESVFFGLIGLGTSLLFGFVDIELGGALISSSYAWSRGVVQIYVAGGTLLVGLAFFLNRGQSWARFPILFWYPVVFGLAAFWAAIVGVAKLGVGDLILGYLPIAVIWVYFSWRVLFGENASEVS